MGRLLLLLPLAACGTYTHNEIAGDDTAGELLTDVDTADTAPPAPDQEGGWAPLECTPNFATPTRDWTAVSPRGGGPRPVQAYTLHTNGMWITPEYVLWDDDDSGTIRITSTGANAVECVAWEWIGS